MFGKTLKATEKLHQDFWGIQ